MSPKSLIFIPLLNPEAKNPPNGETNEVNKLKTIACNWKSLNATECIPKIGKGSYLAVETKTLGVSHVKVAKGDKGNECWGQIKY